MVSTDAELIERIRVLRDTWIATGCWSKKAEFDVWHIRKEDWRRLCSAIVAVCNAVEIPRGQLESDLEASLARYVGGGGG